MRVEEASLLSCCLKVVFPRKPDWELFSSSLFYNSSIGSFQNVSILPQAFSYWLSASERNMGSARNTTVTCKIPEVRQDQIQYLKL